MIVRTWRGQTTVENADAYFRHLTGKVLPAIARIAGHRGADVLRRETARRVEFLVLTRWESAQAVQKFAGENFEAAVVDPEARPLLAEFDTTVSHYELAFSSAKK
jgi:heme-degrading monooxygenase HmoA